jgi:putative ABC transport system permease protein
MNGTKQGGFLTLVKIAYRNIWRNGRRTAFCLTAAGIAVFFIVVYGALIQGMKDNIYDLVRVFDLGDIKAVSARYEAENEYMPVQYPLSGGQDWRDIAAGIREIPGVKAVFPRIAAMATLQDSTVKHGVLWGLNMAEEAAVNSFNMTDRDSGLREGRWPAPGSSECAVGWKFAEKSGLRVGDRIPLKTVSAQFSDRMWNPEITGIFNFDYPLVDQDYIIVDFDRLQRLLVLGGGTQQLVVFADDPGNAGTIARSMREMLGPENIASNWQDNYFVAMMEMMTPIYTVIFLVFLTVASFLIINTVSMIIQERIKEIGMMGSLGMTRLEIVLTFFIESVFLAAFGALAGAAAGGILTGLLSNTPLRLMDMMGNTFNEWPMGGGIFFDFSIPRLLQGWLMGVAVTSVFTLIPSLKSAFVEPVEALRR